MAGTSSGSCNTTDPGPAFEYQTNNALQQCRQYTFSAYTDAVQPVTIMGIIPGGQAFTLSPPKGPDSFDWTANVADGTSVVFIMIDAQGRQGGSSNLLTVAETDDPSCLNSTSPSSTEAPIASPTSTSGSPSPSPSGSDSSGPSTGAIVGIVIGALLFIAVVISLVLFCIRRRQEHRNPNNWIEASGAFSSGRRRSVDIDLLAGDEGTNLHPPYADSRNPNSLRPIPPSTYHDNRSSALSHPITQYSDSFDAQSSTNFLPPGSVITPFTGEPPSTNRGTSRGTKGSMAPSLGAPRYILHHDAEDIAAEEEEEEVVELPPMYKPRVGPSTSGSASGSASTSGNTALVDRKEPIPS
ncbi:hypothetical protein BDP27DRAFT_1358226 [Rhodocollybia butyracea]|uniref:Uncharacterized protein n=1 Tax=Rhodocollybia butyracea TaxID=206335 RepID=A0A9P5Q9I2_9AGAR|nr:hypothetical protein BDP27DRAFT_1358226 [Rhodocollybia butyracea]